MNVRDACVQLATLAGVRAEGIITACHLTLAGPKGQMSDQNLVWSDILTIEIIRTRLNVWQFLNRSGIMSDHFRKVIIPTVRVPRTLLAALGVESQYSTQGLDNVAN